MMTILFGGGEPAGRELFTHGPCRRDGERLIRRPDVSKPRMCLAVSSPAWDDSAKHELLKVVVPGPPRIAHS